MLQTEESQESRENCETLCEKPKQLKMRTCYRLRIVLGLFVLLAVLVFLFYMLRPTYTATAYIQILSQKQYFVFEEKQKMDYDNFVNTQFAIIKSPIILGKALEAPNVSQLPIIKSQKDKIAWLARKLKIQKLNNTEMVTLSITLPVPEDAEKIVNSVINAFFDYYTNQLHEWNFKLITQLNLELNRQRATARLLQNEIRNGLEQAAKLNGKSDIHGIAQGESILRELSLNELKLETLRAELKMLREIVANPSELEIPAVIVQKAVENDPILRMLQQRKIDLQDQITPPQKNSVQDNEPKILSLQKQIKEIEEKIKENKSNTEEIKKKLQTEYVLNLGTKIIETQMSVRLQTILVENLRQKYHDEQLTNMGERTVKVIDTQFQQEQLRRVNTIVDQLESRIIAIETERYAPPQIELKRKAVIPTQSNHWWW